MTLPVDITTITITGTYLDPQHGSPLEGSVLFGLSTPLTDSTGHVTLGAGVFTAELVAGSFSITLPCTDNPTLSPTPFAYLVAVQVPGAGQAFLIQVPHTLGATVDITELTPANPPASYSTVYGVLVNGQTWTGLNVFQGGARGPDPSVATDFVTRQYLEAHGAGVTFGAVVPQLAFGGVSADGVATSASRSDHAHGTPSMLDDAARMLNLVAQPFPIQVVNKVDLGATSGFLLASLIRPGKGTVTNLGLWVGAAGTTGTGVNAMGLYDVAGNLLGSTGDMTAALAGASANTYVEAPLTVAYAAADATDYYVALLCHFSSQPTIGGILAGGGLAIPTVKGRRSGVQISGQATLPASWTPATADASVAAYWLVAS